MDRGILLRTGVTDIGKTQCLLTAFVLGSILGQNTIALKLFEMEEGSISSKSAISTNLDFYKAYSKLFFSDLHSNVSRAT